MPNTAVADTYSPVESLLTIGDVAGALRMSREQVVRLITTGELPTIQIGGRGHALRVARADLEAMQSRWRR
jgi:excisionase family DNA binding protein